MHPSTLAFLAMLSVTGGCCLAFATLALRADHAGRTGYQRFLLDSHVADVDRRPLKELDRALPALLLSAVAASVSIAAGVGGGAFFVPLFNVLLQFSVKGATALSQASITGGAISGVACLMLRTHPLDPSKALIDLDLALMLTPVLLFGVSVGVLANSIFPTWLITFLLIALLLYITFLAVRKSVTLHRQELRAAMTQQQQQQQQQKLGHSDDAQDPAEESGTQHLLADISVHCPIAADSTQHSHTDIASERLPSCFEIKTSIPSQIPTKSVFPLERRQSLSDTVYAGIHARLLRPSMGSQPSCDSLVGFERVSGDEPSSLELSSTPRLSMRFSHSSLPHIPGIDEMHSARSASSLQHQHEGACNGAFTQDIGGGGSLAEDEDEGLLDEQFMTSDSQSAHALHAPDISGRDEGEEEQIHAEHCRGNSLHGSAVLSASSVAQSRTCCTHSPHAGMGEGGLQLPWLRIAQLSVLWAAFLALQLTKSRQTRCNTGYFVLFGIQALLAGGASVVFTWQAYKVQQTSQGRGWTLPQLIRASATALVGGVVAGLLGIGGGMIIGPMLLELGVHPLVSAATSSLMVLFSSSMGALAYAFQGALNLRYALLFGTGCCAASLVGVLLVSRIVKRSGKASIVVMLLACIVGTGALLTAGFGGRNAMHDLMTHHEVGFSSFC